MEQINDQLDSRSPEIFRRRNLEQGGTLFIFEQAHREKYPRQIIENDVNSVHPDALIIENTRPFGPGLEQGQIFVDNVKHQIFLANNLKIPVIFADLYGAIGQTEALSDPNFWSLISDLETKEEKPADIPWEATLGCAFLTIPLIARQKNMTRRDFLKWAGIFLTSLALPSFLLHRTNPKELQILKEGVGNELLSIPGNLYQNEKTQRLADNYESLERALGDQEKMLSFVIGLRNAKYISVAESTSQYLQKTSKIAEPKIGLIVGQAHGFYLEDSNRHSTAISRTQTIERGIKNVFIPTYRWLKQAAKGNSVKEALIETRAIMDLNHIAIAGVYDVMNFASGLAEKNIQPINYILCEDVVEGITSALQEEPTLLISYQQEFDKLRQKFLTSK